jgi:transcriptional regulator with XRE-family HTH domain
MAHNEPIQGLPVAAVEAEIGRRLESARLAANVSQAELAAEAGVSRRTITRLESGEGVSVNTLIRVLRALGLGDRLAALLPEAEVSPIDRVRLKGQTRQRARPAARPEAGGWTWSDDADPGPGEA